jgi:hypothetical protein
MSNKSRDVIFSEKEKPLRGAPLPRKGLEILKTKNVNDENYVIDLNQHKLDSGLSKSNFHDLVYNPT